jgi:hypothetical protein
MFPFTRQGQLFAGLGLALVLCAVASAQDAIAIKDAHVITASGADLQRCSVLLRDGLIQDVGPDIRVPPDAWVIDGARLTVYPGFIDGLSTWGIASAAPVRTSSAGSQTTVQPPAVQPAASPRAHGPEDRPQTYSFERAADLVTPMDTRLETARAAGYTSAATFPNRGIVEGLGAIVNLAGDRGRDMVVVQPIGQQVVLRSAGFRAGFPNSLMGDIAYVRQLYLDLDQYRKARLLYAANPRATRRPGYDHDLEGLAESPRILLPADEYQQIDRMLAFGKELGVPFVLYGAHEAFARVDQLKRANVPVLVSLKWPEKPKDGDPTQVPNYRDLILRDQAPSVPGLLAKAGVKFAFFSDNLTSAPDLKKAVRKAIDAGLAPADAVRALTVNVAEIYGVSDRLGTIEKGKIANVVVSKGDIFDEKSTIQYLFIDGREFRPSDELQQPPSPRGSDAKPPSLADASAGDVN